MKEILRKIIRAAKAAFPALLLLGGINASFAQLDLSPPSQANASPGDTIAIPLALSNPAGAAIDAFGVTLAYPANLADYAGITTTGTLTQGWLAIDGSEITPGEITIGGFNLSPITASGVLVRVRLAIPAGASGQGILHLFNFVDDLSGATTSDGELIAGATAIHAPDRAETVSEFRLYQNYPNPFNSETRIVYELFQPGRVRLVIYDMLGREVRELMNENQPAGKYNLFWDGTARDGSGAASGVYIYTLSYFPPGGTGKFLQSRTLRYAK
ncbi:MAG: T9SS type A sorting domain-containing protein [Calditrichaceae bacterium]|nr:T9SS type A sorting domain-containing protein [Calditrichia bacterium]NUQ41479.1 T9SS type A sorting domain-containing protein [Calditrichaceae bacterium]